MSVFFLCQYSGRKEEVYLITAKFYLHYTTERTQKVEVWALLSTSPTLQFIEHNRLPALQKLQQKDKMEECLCTKAGHENSKKCYKFLNRAVNVSILPKVSHCSHPDFCFRFGKRLIYWFVVVAVPYCSLFSTVLIDANFLLSQITSA